MNKYLSYVACGVLATLSCNALAAASAPIVISVSATSAAANSAPAVCTLDPSCKGKWTSGMADDGSGEGISVQFESPVKVSVIRVESDRQYIQTSVNGSRLYPQEAGKNAFVSHLDQLRPDGRVEPMEVKSLFVQLSRGERTQGITKIAFYSPETKLQDVKDGKAKPLILELPIVSKATVNGTSVLAPETAYQVANLFDSRIDMAWATDGKKTTGVGESLSITLQNQQTITGLSIWNGYQRSESHFQANGRVASLEVTDGTSHVETVELKDQMAMQTLQFKTPFQKTSSLKLKIKKIYAGTKYKDVLLSELRLRDGTRVIALNVQPQQPKIERTFERYADRKLYSTMCDKAGDTVQTQSFKFRKDGTFVIYKTFEDLGDGSRGVWEGNWEPSKSGLRVFGKKYSRTIDWRKAAYGQETEGSKPEIFQTDVRIRPIASVPAKERESLYAEIKKSREYPEYGPPPTLESLVVANAILIQAPLFYDITVPDDSKLACRD